MAYKYYQPNKKDVKDKCGDCSIRALTKCFEITWAEAFKMMIAPVLKYQVLFDDTNSSLTRPLFEEIGLKYTGVTVKAGKRRPTVAEFAKSTKGDGRHYIAKVAHHTVAVYNGDYFDTWDSGKKPLYGYFTRIEA